MSLLSRLAVQAARAYGILSSNKNNVSASYLVVAGGGGGGSYAGGGGGGAGGYLASTAILSILNTYTVTVGAGGVGGVNATPVATSGSNSVLSGTGLTTVTSTGGGFGAGYYGSFNTGASGGSGGGNAYNTTATGGTGTSGQGNNGGGGSGGGLTHNGAGGGGGASAVGGNSNTSSGAPSGNGGAGSASSISGSSVTYAGGGGGGNFTSTAGTGGSGGGGNGGSNTSGSAGTVNLGGGGGGSGSTGGAGGAGGSGVVIISYTSATPRFVGGTLTTSGGNQIHTFTSSGTLSPITPVTASYLVVAGGGGGGRQYGGQGSAGGGGAGGLLTSSTTIYSGATYVVTVGAGGAGGSSAGAAPSGSDSSLSGTGLTTITATGGGGGAGSSGLGASGGSGGGGQGETAPKTGGAGTSGQGFAGGTGAAAGGGGGGASAVGANAATNVSGGNGGAGTASSISGTSVTYAGGGGGGGYTSTAGTGGAGGGGTGQTGQSSTALAVSGTTNLGGGGGGAAYVSTGNFNGAAGGSGVVIISYAGSQVFNGGLVTSSGGNTIHTFTATGALTPLTNNLTNSLRFRKSANAYLSRTPTVTGNRKTFTWSGWVKRGEISTSGTSDYALMCVRPSSGVYTLFSIRSANAGVAPFAIIFEDSASTAVLATSNKFRDVAAWYHIVLAVDTTQATAANRVKIYINGNQVTSFDTYNTYPTLNSDMMYNTANPHNIGRDPFDTAVQFDGYMDDVYFIDGQALEPYFFGNNDANGVWKPIQYRGTYGTNGFYLNFSNTTSTTTLGNDSSGNGNNWTTNNISLTAGVTYDAMTDVPTNTNATTANYSVYNPLIPSSVSGSAVRSISAGNLYVTNSGPSGWSAIGTTMVMTSGSGRWYWEVTCSGTTSNGTMIGIHRPFTSTSTFPSAILGYDTPPDPDGYGYYMGGNKYNNSGAGVAYGASYTAGDIIGVALDMSTAGSASITFYKNNTSQGVAFSSLTGDFFAAVSQAQANGLDINFGQRPFSYTPPSGFVALNTFNLPTPTILQGNKYMDATTWTGNGSTTRTITNASSFRPDFVWMKERDIAIDHLLYDSIRGPSTSSASKALCSNTTVAEGSQNDNSTYGYLDGFASSGFTVTRGSDGATSYTNKNNGTYVAWQWQAGQGSTSSNTQGSITSTVSVNTTAGFSIATFTKNATNVSVGHGLGVAPAMIIVKGRGPSTSNWLVYHKNANATPQNGGLVLELTSAFTTNAGYWNNTAPTSTVFTVGSFMPNENSVAYCWAEIAGFSRFGSYTGNGSADGPFVYTGFRPRFILSKRFDSTGDWWIWDTSRNTFNVVNNFLYPNLGDAEASLNAIDILSNGFKFRNAIGALNASGFNYIYMAFAENPFKNANAR